MQSLFNQQQKLQSLSIFICTIVHRAMCQRVYSANLPTAMSRKFTDHYLVKKVKPFEWIQETQGAPCFISRSCCYNCPHWTQIASFLGYHLPTGSIVSPQSALRSRNSSVVRLFWSPLQQTIWRKQFLLCQPGLTSNTSLQEFVLLQILMSLPSTSTAPPPHHKFQV